MSKRRTYTMSPVAKAQRRAAAWKHGQRAATVLTQTVPPCKKSLCPLTDETERGRCLIKRNMDEQGKPLEICPVQLSVNPDTRQAFMAAMDTGDLTGLREITATLFAGMTNLSQDELAKVMRDGLAIDFDVYNKDGDVVGSGKKVNPAIEPLLKILEMLGVTAPQQAITPKSAGEKTRDGGIGATLDFYARRAALAGPPMKRVGES